MTGAARDRVCHGEGVRGVVEWSQPMNAALDQKALEGLPLFSWNDGTRLTNPNGGQPLKRRGSVQEACRILDDCDREVIYDLIEAGIVDAYKRQPDRPNSHWVVDLYDVWRHKQASRARIREV